MATKQQQQQQIKLAKNVRVLLQTGREEWEPGSILAVSGIKGYKVLLDSGDMIVVPPARSNRLTPTLDQNLVHHPQTTPEGHRLLLTKQQFEQLTQHPESRYAKAPPTGRRVTYKPESGTELYYCGTVSGEEGNFIYIVLDNLDLQSPVRVASDTKKIGDILDRKLDTRSGSAFGRETFRLLTSPNYSATVRALRTLSDGEGTATLTELSAMCETLVSAKRAAGLSGKPATSLTVYTLVAQELKTVKRTLQERSVVLPRVHYSMWDSSPQTTAHRLAGRQYGIVAEWSPPRGAVELDLAELTYEMLGNQVSVSKLKTNELKALITLNSVFQQTHKYVLNNNPDSVYVSGLLTSVKALTRQVGMMDIEHHTDAATGITYLRLFQIQNSLDELGLA